MSENNNVRRRKVSDYQPDPENANQGSERGQQMIEDSVRRYGAGRSLLVDKNGVLIGGNKTQQAAIDAGLENVIEVETEGDALVVVRRKDLDLLDEDNRDARILAYLDNRSAEVSLTWNAAQIYQDLQDGVDLSGMFTEEEMKMLIRSQVEQNADDVPPPGLERIDEIHAKWEAKPGNLWVIPSISGEDVTHRLFCGDSTNGDDVLAALGDTRPNLCVTDPPYGVNYDADWRWQFDPKRGKRAVGKVTNDDTVDWTPTFELFPGNVIYCWHAGLHAGLVAAMLYGLGFDIRAQIIWRKQNFVTSRGHYHWQHEPCYYAVRRGQNGNWRGDRSQSTIWDIANMAAVGQTSEEGDEATGHSTQKPVEAMRRPIINHTLPGEYVYEPFCGSGTTFMAAEKVGRGCVGLEIEPKYVSLTLQRFADMGMTPERAERP